MATSQKLTEHFLSCTICTEVFDSPCTLVCNHTFCRKCVISYTKTKADAISAKSLLCPFCSKMTKVAEPDKPVEEWADDVKPSFVIQGLLDSFGPGSKDTTNCRYCKEEEETTTATPWCSVCDDALCERCVRMHNRHPSSRHHEVVSLSAEVKVKRRRQGAMCKDHRDEGIKLMCKDCKKAVCQTCIIYHRNCKCVVEIKSEIPAMKSELGKNKYMLMKGCAEMKTLVDKQKTESKEESKHYLQMESDIKSATNKAIDVMKQKERKLLNELKEMSGKHIGQLKADIKSGEMSVQMYQQEAELINQSLQSECDLDVYEMYQGCEVGDVEAVTDADVKERRIAKTVFRQDTDKLSKDLDDLQLGVIDVLYESVLDIKATPVLLDTIKATVTDDEDNEDEEDGESEGDGEDEDNEDEEGGEDEDNLEDVESLVIDVTVLAVKGVDTVVVTDIENDSVKSFYTSSGTVCHSKLSLGGTPWGVTKLKHNQVAVTVPDMSQIVTVEVNPDLVLLSTITTSKEYFGITSLTPSTLAAGSNSPPCVDILDMAGLVMSTIKPLHNETNILQAPGYLCTTRLGNILVSDYESKCVVCLTPGGDVVFTYSPTGDTALERPAGVTIASTGDIMVTDNSKHRVICLTESGKFTRNILTSQGDVHNPTGIFLDGRGNMYVSMPDVVKVFSLSGE